jgi:hypothetical protein
MRSAKNNPTQQVISTAYARRVHTDAAEANRRFLPETINRLPTTRQMVPGDTEMAPLPVLWRKRKTESLVRQSDNADIIRVNLRALVHIFVRNASFASYVPDFPPSRPLGQTHNKNPPHPPG